MQKVTVLFFVIFLFIVSSVGFAIGSETINEKIYMSTNDNNKLIYPKLEKIEESIHDLIISIWDSPIKKKDHKQSKEDIAAIPHIKEQEMKEETIKQRLAAIKKTITNIETALAKSKTKIGENCHWVSVCTHVVCTKYGLPASSGHGTSGGTPVCLESECRAWEDRFVCN